MNSRGQVELFACVLVLIFIVTVFLFFGHEKNKIRPSLHNVKVAKLKPSCDDKKFCKGRYAKDVDGNWYFYNYTFQGTDSTNYQSIPPSSWSKGGSSPKEEEIEEKEFEAETDVDVESEMNTTDATIESDSGSSDNGASDSGSSDGGSGDGGGDGGGD